jgi:hypothetical protein
MTNNKQFTFSTTIYSLNQLLSEVIQQVSVEIADLTFGDYNIERDCVQRLPTITRRPWSEADHVVLFGFYHAEIVDDGPNITVPNNVIMVKIGTAGRMTFEHIKANKCDFMEDLHLLANYEYFYAGCEIVPGGGVYPNLYMQNNDMDMYMGLYGCNKNKSLERLIPHDTTGRYLDEVLKTASEHVAKSGKMALLFIGGCQDTNLGEKVSVGTDATYQAINILPSTIRVVTFGGERLPDFDVKKVIKESIEKRTEQPAFLDEYKQSDLNKKYYINNVVPRKRLDSLQNALNRRPWDSSTRVPHRGGSVGRTSVPFWTLVVITVLAALTPRGSRNNVPFLGHAV